MRGSETQHEPVHRNYRNRNAGLSYLILISHPWKSDGQQENANWEPIFN